MYELCPKHGRLYRMIIFIIMGAHCDPSTPLALPLFRTKADHIYLPCREEENFLHMIDIQTFISNLGHELFATLQNYQDLHIKELYQEFVVKACGNIEEDVSEGFQHERASVSLNDPQKGEESTGLTSDPSTSGMQTTEEVIFGWKLVIHEQTNQYYYWNIETGETSWEAPAIFAQGMEVRTDQKALPVIEETASTLSNTTAYNTLHREPFVYSTVATGDQCNGTNFISHDEEKCKPSHQAEIAKEGHSDENFVVVYPELNSGIHTEIVNSKIRTSPGSKCVDEHILVANGHPEAGLAHPTQLVRYAESLIQRLKHLERSDIQLQEWDWISRYILEIEIRLSDFNSLLVYGSSLFPYWMHSEEKLRGLECAINDHISQLTMSGQTNRDAGIISHKDGRTPHLSIEGDSELNVVNQILVSSCSSPNIDTAIIKKEADDILTLNDAPIVKGSIPAVNETVLPKEFVLQSVSSAVEDEDMDVDMEVEDEAPINDHSSRDALGAKKISPPEQFIQPDLPRDVPPSVLETEYDVPPPPDEEWIPPPPPDAEPVPPPPPDDPPSPTYIPQPPYSEAVPYLPYTAQYTMSYPLSSSEYYGPVTTEVPSLNYYAHAEEPRAVESQSAQYFDAVSTTTSTIINPIDPLVYYGLPSGPPPLVPSIIYGESGPLSYHNTTAEQKGTLKSLGESECTLLPNLKGDSVAFAVSQETEMLAEQVAPLSTTVQATITIAPVPSTTAISGAIAQSTSAAKAPTKGMRIKKKTIGVTPTLRSNKKVSSLVDKWKAAKEELHEDEEDEPQNAYEMLERKRQREIDAWRAQQIATGEAKDNANFQPLGGDWRERVKKRRRAKSSISESMQSLPDASIDGKQPPDLIELSKDLPPGWQAYWDESSQKAYYGNTITSETTWTRPAQ
ncbi:Ww domain-containing protein [Thalictrum thalictroides]|uniref:Ww domain-containing protein n=1 Tax=Thalictrum thalictroides TaxID=46969 RepID=A0A7J6WQI9_THATH|nr:Ww domain-containing protein [Thalictrum thalictroides]